MDPKRIAILTFAVGADYKRNLAVCLQSKRDYAARHGYTYIEAGEEYWDRDRPIAWSKIPFWLDILRRRGSEFDYLWISDADVLITNPALKLEDHVLPFMPAGKNLMWNHDACRNINSGNMIFRPCPWLIQYLEEVWNKTDDLYHIWWENKAMIDVMMQSKTHMENIHINKEHWRYNAYIGGRKGERLWTREDFLVHFAGVYDTDKIRDLCEEIKKGNVPRVVFFPPEAFGPDQDQTLAEMKAAGVKPPTINK